MALTSLLGHCLYPTPPAAAAGDIAFTPLTMNATGEKVAFVFRVPLTGTLDSFECKLGTVSNVPDNGLRFSFQDLNSSGDPDGTQDQFRDITSGLSSNAWLVPPGPLTNDGTGGGTKRSVTAGQLMACVIDFVTFVASDAVQIDVVDLAATAAGNIHPVQHYTSLFTGAWTKNFNAAPMALKYDTGAYVPIAELWYPCTALNGVAFNSGSSPDERGLRFQVPVQMTINGFWARCDLDGACDFVLYDSDGTTPLATVSYVLGQRSSTGAANVFVACDPIDLAATTTYRLIVKPTSVTSLTLYDFDVSTAAHLAGVDAGAEWHYTQRTDAGAWSQTTTKRPWMGLSISRVHSATGGSGSGGSYAWVG